MAYIGKYLREKQPENSRCEDGFPPLPIFILPLSVIYFELILRRITHMQIFHAGLPAGLFCALAFVMPLCLICAAVKSGKVSFLLCLVFLELLTIWYGAAYFIEDSYKVFMQPTIVLSVAGNAVKDFDSNIAGVFLNGLPIILLFHIPVILMLILRLCARSSTRLRFACTNMRRLIAVLFACMIIFSAAGYGLSICTETLRNQFRYEYTYDNAVRRFGLLSALEQDILRSVFGYDPVIENTADADISTPAQNSVPPSDNIETFANSDSVITEPIIENPEEEEDEVVEYGYNSMELDFSGTDSAMQSVNDYVLGRTPSRKNEYTGIFKGKNLILITAEAFSKEIIDPDRTPTLYRLAGQGIVFEDFYQPVWGGSTSTGEYSWLMGIVPADAMVMMSSRTKNLYFTMGNQLQRLGYFSAAYHDGSYDYYQRNQTHTNLGYSTYTGIGNGLEDAFSGGFPASDLEMIDYTVPQYIDKQPFSIYYMTISGHASYGFSPDINDMSVKNEDVTVDMPYSKTVRAYYACNQELEYALESLISQLEDAGIADDTVIALVPDHYPYGLMPSSAWGSKNNFLTELYGHPADTNPLRDHNAAIIWCGSLEKLDEPIVVSSPTSSLDILPTLSNLFGLEYDSRLLVGRDVLSDTPALVLWTDYSWLTDVGYYDSHERHLTLADGSVADEEYEDYINEISADVREKIDFSKKVATKDYYGQLFGKIG